MTSKPSVGIQRQPQRPSSGAGIQQIPVPQRSLSQQYSLSSTVRRVEGSTGLGIEVPEVASYGRATLGGPRLRTDTLNVSTATPDLADGWDATTTVPEPRGRPPLHRHPRAVQRRPPGSQDTSHLRSILGVQKTASSVPVPLPRRPLQTTSPAPNRSIDQPVAAGVKKESRPKPYVLEAPTVAPRLQSNGNADFFPWTGGHPEDEFNDHVIRQGYSDKLQPTQNETASARPSMFAAVKHKSGLQTLSSLFTTVFSQRRAHSQITATPTFKPPPRVTLTDTKRETWLRDLANPAISLRRLSRTIPHGIRGKVLLEQCLSKQIPTERAIWLVKCVGANEIRAFKRKGVTGALSIGGEAKWIRDWTAFVEQFVESVIASCGEQPGWKGRVSYATRLSAHLYSEHLLDREHFLDWLLLSLETCPIFRAPTWLLLTQVYWTDLLSSRRFGRRLVAAMCCHLREAHESPDRDLLSPLAERITGLLRELAVSRGDNFVSPRSWQKYKQTLGACLLSNGNDSSARYRLIDLRNRWLSRSQEDMIPSSRQKLISLFDKSLRSPYHSEMATECKQTTSDLTLLGRIILDWCTSAQRPGVTKVYVAARLLRSCIRLETGITLILLDFLGARDHGDGFCKQSLYHVISELARSGHFVISKYLRWLIARGGVRSSEDIAPEGPCATRLLAELPVDDSLDGIDMLRTTIMHRATESTSIGGSERHAGIIDLEDLLAEAAKPIEATKGWEPSIRIKEVANRLSRKSRSEKAETGTWIRQKVCQFMPPSPASSPEDWKGNKIGGANTITHNEFILVRAVLESIEDFSMLADVLKMCTHSEDVQVLASIADTLYYHCETFAAIGALEELFERLLIRLRTRSEDSDMTQLQRSMCHLAGKIPGAEAVATQLSQELLQLHHKTAADACSPVSDHMTERLDVSESQFVDEVDKVIASGTSMDQATMQRLFDMVTGRLQASWCSPDPQISNSCATLLSKLKCFDVQHFGKLARVWVNKVVATPNRPGLRDIFASLIAQDCVEFKELTRELRTFLDDYVSTENTPAARQSVRDVLVFIVGSASKTENLFYEDGYRLRAMRLSMQATLASDIIAIIKRCVELSPELSCGEPDENSSLYGSEAMRIFFQRAVLRNPDLVTRDFVLPLVWNSHPDCRAVVGELMKCWLALDPASVGLTWDAAHHIEQILRSADELNLPFCQVALRSFVVDDVVERGKGDEEPLGYMAAFERAMDKAIQGDDKSWMIIVPLLDAKIASHVYHRAESLLLQLIPSLPSDEPAVESRDENENRARRLLSILSATSDGIKVDPNASLTSQVVDKLSDLWELLMQGDIRSRNSAIELWLPVLLDLVIFHATYWDNSKSSSEFRSRILLCLASFLLELQGRGHNHPLLLQQIFDVSLLLVDDLPEDARSNCVRSLKDKTSDSRIQYIFGYSTASMDWMQLNQKGKLMAYPFRRWEILSEPTPNVGENDTSLSLTLFNARRV